MAQFITATVNVIVPVITMPIVISYICNNKHPLNFPCRRTQRPLLACRSSSRLRLWPDRSAAKPTWFVFASPALFWADSQGLQRGWYPLPDMTHIIILFSNDEIAFKYAPARSWVCLFVHAFPIPHTHRHPSVVAAIQSGAQNNFLYNLYNNNIPGFGDMGYSGSRKLPQSPAPVLSRRVHCGVSVRYH